jgi:hypothetical protein
MARVECYESKSGGLFAILRDDDGEQIIGGWYGFERQFRVGSLEEDASSLLAGKPCDCAPLTAEDSTHVTHTCRMFAVFTYGGNSDHPLRIVGKWDRCGVEALRWLGLNAETLADDERCARGAAEDLFREKGRDARVRQIDLDGGFEDSPIARIRGRRYYNIARKRWVALCGG